MRTRQLSFVAIVLLLCGAHLACVAPAVHTSVPQFANAVTLATENSKGAFQVVDQKYMEVEADALVVDYERTGFDPRKVKHLLTSDELQVRIDLLNALQQYAKTLSQVSSDSKLQEFDDQTKALGKNLQDLASTDAFKKLVQTSGTQVNIATTAIDALGRWFIERKRQKELPNLIEAMQDPVKRTAELLEADIGNRPDDQGNGGSGLRGQLWNEYMHAMLQQSAIYAQEGCGLVASYVARGDRTTWSLLLLPAHGPRLRRCSSAVDGIVREFRIDLWTMSQGLELE